MIEKKEGIGTSKGNYLAEEVLINEWYVRSTLELFVQSSYFLK
jgi:hypothetical protein